MLLTNAIYIIHGVYGSHGAAARGDASGCCKEGTYCTQLVLQGCYVKGAAARCRVQLLEWRVRSGAGWWCRCRVLLQGAAVKVACALWSWHVGAIAGCRCRVLLSDFPQKQQEA